MREEAKGAQEPVPAEGRPSPTAEQRCYRHFPDGTRLVAVRRREDGVWHAERVRNDGLVAAWAYGESLADVLGDLDLAGWEHLPTRGDLR